MTAERRAPTGPSDPARAQASDSGADASLEAIERLHILHVLEHHGGNKAQAAKTLQIDYKTLLSKLKKYGVGNSEA